ncbi:MAG: hypothetical protein US96_C0012G0021 [Candidatus Woesebacteria bacterium GW2011_GWB1_38_5b]|uniref:Type II secretion system protein GspF domain-containing protein n=1 Tax=Candidatus Woesebacteria bacterium GW2011_GWB1_38_5b TaxID=1618569 RepID=A0A0G0K960_9BACT|nr:MAG: hypothetical protein US96_C0012G0021 [Candidatus Woesebacteria bacterium GW2011_GWB1_38_5b]
MKRYTYKAKDKTGHTVTGEVEASDQQRAAKLLRQKGYIVISISSARGNIADIFKSLRQRVSSGDLAAFTRQLSTMINAGLPITETLSILRFQAKPALAPVVTQILADVEGGESLSVSMAKHKKVFSNTYVALIKAGETGGVLDKVMLRLADNLEKQHEFQSKVKGALIYPAIIVVGMIVVSIIMIIFVIPRMTELYTQFDTELPLPTKILLTISDVALKFWPVFVALAGIILWGFRYYRSTKAGRLKTDEWFLKIPLIGPLQQQITLAELSRTMSLLVGAGVPILEGLAVTAEVIKNSVISEALKDAARQIEKGFPISFSFAKHPEAFPYILSQMVAVGEETGKMEEVLEKVSHVFEMESETRVKALTSSIEPIIMIILGIGVAFLVIAVILPIYNLTTAL